MLITGTDEGGSFRSLHLKHDPVADPMHRHGDLELTLVARGTGVRVVEDSMEIFRPGDLVLIGPEIQHCWVSVPTEELEAYTIQFRENLFEPFPECADLGDLFREAHYGTIFTEVPENLKTTISQAVSDRGIASLLKLLASLFLLNTVQRSRLLENRAPKRNSKTARRMGMSSDYIFNNFQGELRLENLAAECSMPPPSFSRWFAGSFGFSFTDWVNRFRAMMAGSLLLKREMKVKDCGELAGFDNSSTYNRVFRQIMGTTPGRFRKADHHTNV